MAMRRATLPILGFGCAGSGALIAERALARVPGVINVYVNPVTEMAYVRYDDARCALGALIKAIEGAGFKVGAPIAS
jgi:P-type Cu2+ transporter